MSAELEIDYTKYAIGVALAADIHIKPCPKCGKPCHIQMSRTGGTYVHGSKVVKASRNANPHVTLTKYCSETHEQIAAREKAKV